MNRLVEDLRLINQLKDSSYQYDAEDNRAKVDQPKTPNEGRRLKM